MKKLALALGLGLVAGCSLQVTDTVLPMTPKAVVESVPPSNDLENFLVITRVIGLPSTIPTGDTALLVVEYQENMGRPVSVSWFCDKGTLVSDKGLRVNWIAPETPQVCDCEVTVKSKSGSVRSTVKFNVK